MLTSKNNRLALYVSAGVIIVLILFAFLRDNSEAITLSEATMILKEKSVKKVVVSKEYVYLKTDDGYFKIASSQVTPKMFVDYKVEVGNDSNILVYILFIVVILGLGSLLLRIWQKKEGITLSTKGISGDIPLGSSQEGISSIKSTNSDVSFDDIGGISDVKIELEEIIDFMKNPKRYKSFGARMPRGVLLVGPPGVGKTMIAKAVAHAAEVPFYYQSGASFVQIYVGMGAKRVHDLFSAAKKNAPSIIFIDEIDAVGKKRGGERNDEREATLNQLLTEMDGFEGSSGVIVVAATNKIEVLDSALLRAGRFDRRVFVELPTKRERESILMKYLAKIPHELDVKVVANMTVGFNGASLAALVNEAALLSLRQNDFHMTIEHFHQVRDKVMYGKKKLKMLNDKQKAYRITYQAAKVSIATYFDLPFEKLMLSNEKLTPSSDEPFIKEELEFRLKMLLAGMAACDIKYGEHSSSAVNDLSDAKEIVSKMCRDYGMGSSLIPSSDEERTILERQYNEAKELLVAMSGVIKAVEEILLERESITKESVKKLIDEIL
ncbi:AAA family ATPase [Sulfurimonas aquatica]|uniref:AAA family ATPase n=1 Tax=Sulfurimonas aquatica TaxID=2672570 RepID=A0A975AZZ3_9BACT|nr:AAA family ATPase [Sulfurimonas aquatica]QSZ41696.1 AAA family ATPase [Sulfurimonas aquatica]